MRCEFDRGTIILRDLPPGVARAHPVLKWDDRIAAYRAVASDWPELQAELQAELAGFGLELGDAPAGAAPLPLALKPPELRAYQRAALETWTCCGRRGIVVLPTGAGKTRIALAAIAAMGLPTLVLVPTRVLLEQWVRALAMLGDGLGPIGMLGDGRRTTGPLTVATYESAWRHAAILGDKFGLLVIDEAHHAGGALRPEVLEMSLAPFRLGLTALAPSPTCTTAARLEALVGPVVYHLRVSDLAGTGGLAPVRLVGIGLDLTAAERAEWMAEMTCYRAERARHALDLLGLSWRGITSVMARTEAGRRALVARARAQSLAGLTAAKSRVLSVILARHDRDRILVFTRDNATAYALSRAHLVPAITCDVRRREREETLAAFARGDVRVLVSARVLDEGLDIPEASVAVIVGASGSERQHVQRVGRILRPAPGKRATVYDLFSLVPAEAFGAARRRAAVAP